MNGKVIKLLRRFVSESGGGASLEKMKKLWIKSTHTERGKNRIAFEQIMADLKVAREKEQESV